MHHQYSLLMFTNYRDHLPLVLKVVVCAKEEHFMSDLIRFFLRLDKTPIDSLARVIVDNDQKVIVSKDGVVSIDMDNPAVQKDLVNLIKGFKDISTEAPRHREHAS
jgi:hypothetical protein